MFGLRKSGKTSVLLALSRAADADGFRYSILDCQSPTICAGDWTNALRIICINFRKLSGLSVTNSALGDFSPQNAAQSFEKSLNDVYSQGKRTSVIALYEIEHISPVSGVGLWRDGEMARYFWQTIRSYQQRYPGRISFVVAGTNPKITEARQIGGTDNPLLEYVNCDYLGGLPDPDLQRMCEVIGTLMGMEFELTAVATLVNSLGSQPFLARQVCSHIHKSLPLNGRPATITEQMVHAAISEIDFTPLIDDILGSLRERYPDEYECLQWIACGEMGQAEEFLSIDPTFLRHLEGYGLISIKGGQVKPRLGVVIDQIRKSANLSALHTAMEERWGLLASRRGRMEVRFRGAVRNHLIDKHGKSGAAAALKKIISKRRAEEIVNCSLDEIFSDSECRLYWTDIIRAVESDKDYWVRRLGFTNEEIHGLMGCVNITRDAHAKAIADEEFDQIMTAVERLDEAL